MASSTNKHRSTFKGLTKGGSLSKLDVHAHFSIRAAKDSLMVSAAGPTPVAFAEGGRRGPLAIPRWKRVLDIGCVLLTLPIWLPLMLFISGWVKITSSGPVLFKQTRVGFGTKPFTILKFRSMATGVETSTHENHFKSLVENEVPMIKLDTLRDSRIIAGGRLLRKTGLDELPQLFNVLRGEMSLVGPRPCLPAELECYSEPQKARFDVLPGLTGYWQVSGKNRTTFNQMVEMDLHYGQRMSVRFDLAILFMTIPALVTQAIEVRRETARRHRTEPTHAPLHSDTVRLG